MKNGTKIQNEVLAYAWELSHDIDFLATILGENFDLTYKRKHNYTHWLCWSWRSWEAKKAECQAIVKPFCREGKEGWFWRSHTDHSFGISDGYHKIIVDDPRFFTDWRWNLEQTYRLWESGVTFFGKNQMWYTKQFIIFD